jgi:hypothetical protein
VGPRASNPNILIVEGHDDKHSVISLMAAHVNWPSNREEWPVHIDVAFGVEEILRPAYLTTHIKAPLVKSVGLMLDADDKPTSRYQRIRNACIKIFPDLPEVLPARGVITENQDGKKLGVWIMPDNASEGCLETFLKYLVPNVAEPVWKYAVEAVSVAKTLGAACQDVHLEKSNLYTWLAWQHPPGQQPGIALTKKILDPHSAYATTFVGWFRGLYAV